MAKSESRLSDERLAELQADVDATMKRHPVNRTMELHAVTVGRLLAELRERRASDAAREADLRAYVIGAVHSRECGECFEHDTHGDCPEGQQCERYRDRLRGDLAHFHLAPEPEQPATGGAL